LELLIRELGKTYYPSSVIALREPVYWKYRNIFALSKIFYKKIALPVLSACRQCSSFSLHLHSQPLLDIELDAIL
jgi:hypothetical protein